MASLTAHLLESGDHGRLSFHPSCPVCRQERLFGPLPSEPVISRRAQAALASGVLAFSTAAPGVAVAGEPDRRQEGVAAPELPSGDEADAPGFDPGGETALPFETGTPPAAPQAGAEDDSGDGAPLEGEPVDDPDADLVPITEPEVPMPDDGAPAPPAEAHQDGPVEPAVEAQPDPVATAPLTGEPDESRAFPQPPDSKTSEAEPEATRPEPSDRPSGAPDLSPAVPLPAEGPSVPPEVAEPADQTVLLADADSPAPQARESPAPGARFHLVQSGDSLWSIAKRLLGREASPARIAREVTRLWTLNQDRIGTGDPDLLMVGTKLRLR